MAETRIVHGPDGQPYSVPADATEAMISAYLKAIPAANADKMPNAPVWSEIESPAMGMTAAGRALPSVANAAFEFGTSPTAPKLGAAIGKVVGAVAPAIVGGATNGPIGAVAGLVAASKGAWAGGKTGWFSTKLAQDAARPIASALDTAAPYASKALSLLGGASGVDELAQMAEPNRKDIGFLGIGPTDQKLSDQIAVQKMQVQNLVNSGLSLNDAIRRVSEAWRPR